ncbi:glycosyltransferase family 4 protein [Gordonia ajococcus]|uniref:glycosyltransferase family 4 protein n=1 Tax=Gordonia ajococcus TaxID=1292359 RepID=UPI00178485F6|nr:glycosyltransferase [Gordonia ajococcus]
MSDKVIVVSQVPPPVHGSTIMTQLFLKSLRRIGYSPRLIDRRYSRDVSEVGTITLRKILAGPVLVLRYAWGLLLERPRLSVLFLTNRPASFLSDFAITVVTAVFRVPIVLYIHTSGYTKLASRGRLWDSAVRFVFRQARVTVCLGPSLSRDVDSFTIQNPEFISNYVEAPSSFERTDSNRVVFLSNLLPEKGALTFIKIASRIAEDYPDYCFELAGHAGSEGYMVDVRRAIDETALDTRLSYVGSVDGEAKWAFLANARALVFPSTYQFEAQPLTILEALEVATPVVAFDVGGIRDLASTGSALRLAEPGDLDSLEKLLRQVLDGANLEEQEIDDPKPGAERFDRDWEIVIQQALSGR